LYRNEQQFDRFTLDYLTRFTPPLETINAKTRISDAIDIMCSKNYSQLPIMQTNSDGSESCVGVVTVLSFLQILKQQLEKENDGVSKIMEWPVVRFKVTDEPTFAQSSDEILEYVDVMAKEDFVLVGSRQKCNSIITNSDVVSFFKNNTEVFLLLREIETSLRYVISKCLGEDKLKGVLDSVRLTRRDRNDKTPLGSVDDLSQDELRQIVLGNWDEFDRCFKDKDKIDVQLQYVRDLRNTVFHFRSKITVSELTHIKKLRDNFTKIADSMLRGKEQT
jgi:predicted transcriptional regulator